MRVEWHFPGVIDLVCSAASHTPHFGNHITMGVIDSSGALAAGLVFHDWCPEAQTIEISIAANDPKWATRGVLSQIANYCFQTAGCQMIVARTDEHNNRVRRLWRALGAQEYIIPRMRGRGASEAILTITDDAWASSKFNRPCHEKLSTRAA